MPKSIVEVYDELMHYTSAAGLSGILRSQCLWATHSSFLNDASEIRLFFERRLPVLMEAEVRQAFEDLAKSAEGARAIHEFGGLDSAVRSHADSLTATIRDATLQFNEPYITSFCAPTNSRVRAHGLLSQWRGYGKDGGFAIVFDSVGLQSLLETEAHTFDYMHAQWADVHYYDDAVDNPLSAAEEIHEAEAKLRSGVAAYIRDLREDSFEQVYEAITTLSCLYKHWGFHEEREVRIVVLPSNASVRAATPEPRKPPKELSTFIRDGYPVPYLKLFEHIATTADRPKLPIDRIIVGPHRDSDKRKEAIEVLLRSLGMTTEVHVSEIPYIGR